MNPVRDQKSWYTREVEMKDMYNVVTNRKETNGSASYAHRVKKITSNDWTGGLKQKLLGASYLPANLPAEASAQAGASPAIGNLLRQIRFAYQISMTTCSALKRRQAGL